MSTGLKTGSFDSAANAASNPYPIDLDLNQEQRFVKLLYYIAYLPKWCFGVIGHYVGIQDHEHAVMVAEQNASRNDQFSANDEPNSSIAWLWFDNVFDGLTETLFSHFPAALIVGPVELDMSIVSVVLLSTFCACLTSLFVILLYDLLRNNLKRSTGSDQSTQRRKSRSKPPDLTPFSLPTQLLTNDNNAVKGKTLTEDDYRNGNYLYECNEDINISGEAVVLHQFPRGKYTPCFDMQGLRVETLLRLTGIDHKVQFDCDNTGPWLEYGDEIVWGYHCIAKFLTTFFYGHVARFLVAPELRIQSHLIVLHVEHEICWLLYHWRWFYGINCRENSFAWSKVPDEFVELAASSWNRKFGNVKIDCLVEYLDEALNILSEILGENEYFIENTISEVDIGVFAVLAQATWAMPTTTIEGLIFTKRNLVDFSNRVRHLCWKDWQDHLCSETDTISEKRASNVSNPGFDFNAPNVNVDAKSEGQQIPRRSRTRTFKNATIPFYSPPDIHLSERQAKLEDVVQPGFNFENVLPEHFLENTGTSRFVGARTENCSGTGGASQTNGSMNNTKTNKQPITESIVSDNLVPSSSSSSYENTRFRNHIDLLPDGATKPCGHMILGSGSDAANEKQGKPAILLAQEHAQGDQTLQCPPSPLLISNRVSRSASVSLHGTPWKSKIPVRKVSSTKVFQRVGSSRFSL